MSSAAGSLSSLDLLLGHAKHHAAESDEAAETPPDHDQPITGDTADEHHQAIIFTPAHVAAPHSIPFLPSRPAKTSIITLQSPAIHWRLILSAFIHGYLQHEAHTSPAVVLQSEQWLSPRSKSMEAAVEVTGLLQLDSVKHDERIVLAARKRHAEMIEHFRKELSGRQADVQTYLGAIQTMLVSEVYAVVSHGCDSWAQCVFQIVIVVDAKGPALLSTDFGKYLFLVARLCGLVHALIYRRAFVLGRPRWLKATPSPQRGSLDALFNVAVRLPELLEHVDRHCSEEREHDNNDSLHLRCQLLALDKGFSNWLGDYHAMAGNRYYSGSLDVTRSDDPQGDVRFTSFLSFNFHSMYWICQLLLHSAVMHLAEASSTAEQQDPAEQSFAETSKRLASSYARLLRGSLDYVLQATNGNVSRASAVRLPLYVLQQWYIKIGQQVEATECAALEEAVRSSVPALQWDALLPWTWLTLLWLGGSTEIHRGRAEDY